MTDREKLIELIISSGQVHGFVGALADHLIINGVTVCEREMLHQTYEQGKYEGALEVQKWIPVTERLPGEGETVLVFGYWHEKFQPLMCYLSPRRKGEWFTTVAGQQVYTVTHWMPLPEPPKEGEE